jgi:hypothetical protein
VFQEVVSCPKLESRLEVVSPSKAAVAVSPKADWARIGAIDVCWLSINNRVHAYVFVRNLDDVYHEFEIFAALFIGCN